VPTNRRGPLELTQQKVGMFHVISLLFVLGNAQVMHLAGKHEYYS